MVRTQRSSYKSYIKEKYRISAMDLTRKATQKSQYASSVLAMSTVEQCHVSLRQTGCKYALCSVCVRDMCFPCQHFHYHPAAATCQIQSMMSTMLRPCLYHTFLFQSFPWCRAVLVALWLCSIPTTVIFLWTFWGIISDKYTVFLGRKVVGQHLGLKWIIQKFKFLVCWSVNDLLLEIHQNQITDSWKGVNPQCLLCQVT